MTKKEALERIDRAVRERQPLHGITANMQFVTTAMQSARFTNLVAGAGLVVADGTPLLWLSRLRGTPIPERFDGHEFLDECMRLAAARQYRTGLLGGFPGIGEASARSLQHRYPGLSVCVFDGRFSPEGTCTDPAEEERLIQTLRDARLDMLFVALGCPKQEYWIEKHIRLIDVPFCAGIGGVLDVVGARRKRAPLWMQRAGLEWAFRLSLEPRRLGKRYLGQDLPSLVRIGAPLALSRLGIRSGTR